MRKSQIIGITTCIISCAGTAGTAVMAVKDSKKEIKNPSKNKFKNHIKRYWRTYLCGTLTGASNIVSCIVGYKAINALGMAVAGLSASYRELQENIKNNLTEEEKEKILNGKLKTVEKLPEGDSRELYYTDYTGVFAAYPKDIAFAYKQLNDVLNDNTGNDNVVYLKDFLKWAKAELRNEYEFLPYKDFGYDRVYLEDRYDMNFVHMVEGKNEQIEYINGEDGSADGFYINVLKFNEEPIFLEEGYYGLTRSDIENLGHDLVEEAE